jgi:hypothetical protein
MVDCRYGVSRDKANPPSYDLGVSMTLHVPLNLHDARPKIWAEHLRFTRDPRDELMAGAFDRLLPHSERTASLRGAPLLLSHRAAGAASQGPAAGDGDTWSLLSTASTG